MYKKILSILGTKDIHIHTKGCVNDEKMVALFKTNQEIVGDLSKGTLFIQ
jgi:hypothetical protein